MKKIYYIKIAVLEKDENGHLTNAKEIQSTSSLIPLNKIAVIRYANQMGYLATGIRNTHEKRKNY